MSENELAGQSVEMRDVRRLIDIAAPSKTTILVLGASGTGKELVARSIHKLSARKGELVSINCSSIPAELLESELFGYEKGAFTGAEKMRQGRFEMASGGTLFLDEIISVLDDEGKEKLVEILLGEDLNTYLVSHGWTHPLLAKIEVIKEDNISRLE